MALWRDSLHEQIFFILLDLGNIKKLNGGLKGPEQFVKKNKEEKRGSGD